MNVFTIAQLANKTSGTTYYNTTNNTIQYSPSPVLTMLGNDTYDIHLSIPAIKTQTQLTTPTSTPTSIHKKVKRTRIVHEVPDEERCCSYTSVGNRCTLKKCANSETMCYIHYKKSLPKVDMSIPNADISIPKADISTLPNKKSNKCYLL